MKVLPSALAALLLLPAPALAQAYQCALPRTLPPLRPVAPDGPVRKGPVAGYTLAASWSPDYCKTSGDTRSMQCSRAYGRFGFVLHGLWPQAARGPSLQWCASAPPPLSSEVVRRNLCMTPSPSLLAHEWAKHGTCMTRTPEKYFKVGSILWDSLRWPDADSLSRKRGLTAGDLRDEFVLLNKGWRRDAVGIASSDSGWLREIQLCYGKTFRPARCPARQFGAADTAPLKIWRGL